MDSSDAKRFRRRVRLKYEWGRAKRAVIGFAPVSVIVLVAALLGSRPASTLMFGCAVFVAGALLLWYGRELRRAVLPGVLAGIVPLSLAIGANRFGHVCTGDGCVMLCVPACALGGLIAGLGVAIVGHRGRHGAGFWVAASSLAILTGAMGCACVGYSGLAGLGMGFVAGMVPAFIQRLTASRREAS